MYQSDEKIWWKCSHADFRKVLDPLTCWPSKGVLKQCFLEGNLTKSFTVFKFGNKGAMTIIFVFKIFKIWCRFQKWQIEKKNEKKFLVWKKTGFESRTTNSHNLEKDTCHWQSMCYETSLRFNISLREIFFKSGWLRVRKKYDESALMQILQVFETLSHVDCQRVFWNSFFKRVI